MSYILDALRRAEADRERERGQVPGLHTQPLAHSDTASAPQRRHWLPWAGGGLLLALAGIGAGSWWASSPNETTPSVAGLMPPVPVPPPDSPARPTGVAAAQPGSQPNLEPGTQKLTPAPRLQSAASGSPVLPPAPRPTVEAAAASPVIRGVAVPTPTPAPTPMPATLPAPATAAPPTPSAEAAILRLSELPESTRRELPKLGIAGSVYSEDPASRFVIINGEVLREGAQLGADLVLEQIRPHELVLRFRGQRYRQPV